MKKRLLSVLLAGVLVFSCGCGEEIANDESAFDDSKVYSDEETEEYEEEYLEADADYDAGDYDSSFIMTVNSEDGKMTITRPPKKNESMGDPDTWTIFVYLCGTDLESTGQASATTDLLQMLEGSVSDQVRIVIQTGGTAEWYNEFMDASQGERYLIEAGDVYLVDSVPLTDMGDPETLADFLSWGVQNYPSEKMGVIFWNHGSGSINGVCFDELNDRDSLSLPEINQALSSVYEHMTDQFEFIGFDCCLMATVETANVIANYARYFYASQEIEPGNGWQYNTIVSYLEENPDCDGADLGKVISDSFYDECTTTGEETGCTFSIMDMGKMDDLTIAFNDFARTLYDTAIDDLSGVVRDITEAENFGGNNKSEGYTNMVDLGSIVKNCSNIVDGSNVLSALNDCIVYIKNGTTHEKATGLSIYYPLCIQGSDEVGMFSNICISPYYLSLVDMVAKGYSDGGYSNAGIFDDNGEWNLYNLESDYDESYFEGAEESGESNLITFEKEPYVDEDGTYGFVLDENGLEYAASVEAYVYLDIDDTIVELGETDDIIGDWETGAFADNFDGYWMSLPNGQLLATYLVDVTDDYTVLTSPIYLNGKRTNLRVREYLDYTIVVEGTWDGISEDGSASRQIVPLREGDEISTIYTLEDDSESVADPYIWEADDELIYVPMPAGDYYYGFTIFDVYGDFYVSDPVIFTIDENGDITY